MTREELWRRSAERNPHWLSKGASLTPNGVKRLVEQTYDIAHAHGVENGKALARSERQSIFEQIFGRT